MWHLKKKDTNELIYKTETDSQPSTANVRLLKMAGGGQGWTGVWVWHMHREVQGMVGRWGPAVEHREIYSTV